METTRFKSDTAIFRTRLNESLEDSGPSRFDQNPILQKLGGGVFLDEVAYSRRNGSLAPSSNSFDMALQGDGFFLVGKDEVRFYTRDGRFQRSSDGYLTTLDGNYQVLNPKEVPIQIPHGNFQVNEDGEIFVDGEAAGDLLIVGSVDPEKFEKVGANLYRFMGEGKPELSQAKVRQNILERSSVNVVREMVNLIQSHRAYEMNMQMIRTQDGTLQRAVNDIGRLA